MPGFIDLVRVNAGKETTWGTKVTATASLMGVKDFKLTPIVESEVLKDVRGSLVPGVLAVVKKIGGSGTLSRYASYEDAPFTLDALMGLATPVFTTVYTYSYGAPTTGMPASPRIQTLYQFSNDANSVQAYYYMCGSVLSKLTVKADSLSPVEFSEDYIGKQVLNGVVGDVGTPVDRTITPIMGNDHSLYIDAWAGTIGTTAITPDAYSLEISIDPPRELVYYLGSALPVTWKDNRWKGSMKLTLEFNTANKAYFDAILAGTSNFQKQIRNKFTNGTQSLQFDFAGTNVKAPQVFTNKNGVLTIEFELEGQYNSALANWFKAVAVNGVTVMP